jgi:hypothetical protein
MLCIEAVLGVLAAVRGDGFALTYSKDILQLTRGERWRGVSNAAQCDTYLPQGAKGCVSLVYK